MKLNLVPATASKGAAARTAWVLAILSVLVSVFLAAFMISTSGKALQEATAQADLNKSTAEKAKQYGDEADTIIARSQGPLLNISLARAMMAHNGVYSDFYQREIFPYIPSYFRINSVRAVPVDANTCTVTMTGVVASFQQYADLMLALLRIKGAQAVSRSGYQLNDLYVPPLIKTDQVGRPIKPGQPRLPDNPIDRLDLMISEAKGKQFNGVGGFGNLDTPKVRGATPTESNIAVAVVVTKNLLTPDPRATLTGAAAAFQASAAAAPAKANPAGGAG